MPPRPRPLRPSGPLRNPDIAKKFTWAGTQIRLIEQVRTALDQDLFPLIVTEGRSSGKLEQINHHNYLARAYRSFANLGKTVYVFGHSLSESDEHILRLLEKNSVARLFISIYGDERDPENRRIVQRALAIADRRPRRRPLELAFYDAETAKVWG